MVPDAGYGPEYRAFKIEENCMSNAFKTGEYTNLFELIGKSEDDVDKRIESIWQTFFYGSEDDRIYHPVGDDMGYLEDTGNHDARTEGMSYGMMLCVQTNHKEEFDRIWKWAYTYMWHHEEGWEHGYFAWSCALNGKHNDEGAAPDGEEYFAMALLFASHRWGDGEGIFEYSKHARTILSSMIHKGEPGIPGAPMFNRDNKQILFVAGIGFTDPSYHLPHFYELFSLWADEEDREFFKSAAGVSREFIPKACHPATGMCAEYSEFDGSPIRQKVKWIHDRHDWFFSDSYRTAANIGLDYEWFATDCGQCDAAERLVRFLDMRGDEMSARYEIDGTPVGTEPALHPLGLRAATTEGLLAVAGPYLRECEGKVSKLKEIMPADLYELTCKWLTELWNTGLRTGDRRYYDNCLYFFAYLALGGKYRIW